MIKNGTGSEYKLRLSRVEYFRISISLYFFFFFFSVCESKCTLIPIVHQKFGIPVYYLYTQLVLFRTHFPFLFHLHYC